MEDFNQKPKKKQTRVAPVLGPVKAILDDWIKEDMKKKKKFRRTAKRMWDLLKDNHGFKGSDRTVREYVSMRKEEFLNEADEAAIPLESVPGTAQVDFGEAPFIYGGEDIVLPYLVVPSHLVIPFIFKSSLPKTKSAFLRG
ncbi:transposase [Neobacillus niacini]|nr:transposase [Neobacillus niacini]